jgi:hypothetical protein
MKDPDSKSALEIEQLTKDYIKYMTGKDVEVVLVATGEGSGYINGNQSKEGKKDVFILDVSQIALGESIASIYGHETNHVDDNRRGREAGDEVTSNAAGDRLSEILGENGKNNTFDIGNWLGNEDNIQSLINGSEKLSGEYDGYNVERYGGGDQGLASNIKKLENCKTAQCVVEQTISVINISNGLTLTGVQAQKDIVQAERKKPSCGTKCQAGLKAKEEKLDKLYDITKEGYISLKQTEVDKLNNSESGKTVYEQMKNTDYLSKGTNFNPNLNEWFNSLDFNEIDNSINYAFSGLAQFGESWIASGNPYLVLPGMVLMIPETGKDVGDLLVGLYEKDYGKVGLYAGAIAITGTESVMLVDNYKQTKNLARQVPDFTEVEIDGKTVKINNRHTVSPDGNAKGEVKGNHNEMSFNDYVVDEDLRLRVVGYKEHPTLDGVFEIEYQMARKDKTGNFIDPSEYNPNLSSSSKKTLYDPSKISDQQMVDWATEAGKNAKLINPLNPRTYKGEYNGLEFIFNKQDDGTFKYYPQIP